MVHKDKDITFPGSLVALMGQGWAGPAGKDTFEKQLPNCTATYSGIRILPPNLQPKREREKGVLNH